MPGVAMSLQAPGGGRELCMRVFDWGESANFCRLSMHAADFAFGFVPGCAAAVCGVGSAGSGIWNTVLQTHAPR